MDALGQFVQDLFVPGTSLAEKIVRPIAVYIFLVLILRVGGRRELAQMNAFDLVVLLMLANAVQNAIIGDDNSLFGGFIGGGTLVLLNLAVVRFLYHHPKLESRLEGQPIPLVKDGRLLRENLARELITTEELLAAVHRQGVTRIDDCAEVILETSGTVSVIPRSPTPLESTLAEIAARLERLETILDPAGRSVSPAPPTPTPPDSAEPHAPSA